MSKDRFSYVAAEVLSCKSKTDWNSNVIKLINVSHYSLEIIFPVNKLDMNGYLRDNLLLIKSVKVELSLSIHFKIDRNGRFPRAS